MSPQSTFSILFWIKKTKLKNGKAPVFARITVNGKRTEIATRREISPWEWDPKSQLAMGRSPETKEINNHLSLIKAKLLKCYTLLEARKEPISTEAIKIEFTGAIERPRMLIEIISQHNNDIKSLIGKGYSKATWVKYNTTLQHVQDFLQWKYSIKDIDIKKLSFEFIADFEFFLRSQKNIDINTNSKYIKNIKKIIRECVSKNWLQKNPFENYKLKSKKTDRVFLTEIELNQLQDQYFEIERLDQIRDLFVFSCYTGLAYIDLYNLTPNNISIGIDGEKWLFTSRQKTETPTRLPLLPPALAIIEKYAHNPLLISRKKLLPVPSNQKLNAYLKEIAVLCKINKELTFHIARHTFATTVTLTNGVPIETVSKMLGHTKLQTTQIYAKIIDQKISGDMQQLRQKLKTNKASILKTGT